MNNIVKCDLCDRDDFKNERGLAMHKARAHKIPLNIKKISSEVKVSRVDSKPLSFWQRILKKFKK